MRSFSMRALFIGCAALFFLDFAVSRSQDEIGKKARITLIATLPEDARVELNGRPTSSSGIAREIVTGWPASGSAQTFRLSATWQEKGKEIRIERMVHIDARD